MLIAKIVLWSIKRERVRIVLTIDRVFFNRLIHIGELCKLEEERRNKKDAYEMHRKILTWLSSDDFEETHERNFKKRFENTGQWLLDDPRFRNWRDETQSSLLWCYGARKLLFPIYL